ncbi:MAG TPA: SDR family NAD(P)-dependent oxidoreductase, partial [Acidimicrobiia bacterium]|nr:SDR family NAD(P)-dependent oxidoreductase [Acidimicrobiia bacterium]
MKTTVITGATSGIGRATALELNRRGFHIVVAGRSRERGASLLSEIADSGGSAEFLQLDLGSFDSVRQAAEDFAERGRVIDVMVNNAGVGMAKGLTVDGFEKHFGTNHLGHFLLNHLLQTAFGAGTRIVTVTSSAHMRVDGIDFNRVNLTRRSMFGL